METRFTSSNGKSHSRLTDREGASAADKLHDLKKSITRPAGAALEGSLNDETCRDAWEKLNQRYARPPCVQRAFRPAQTCGTLRPLCKDTSRSSTTAQNSWNGPLMSPDDGASGLRCRTGMRNTRKITSHTGKISLIEVMLGKKMKE